MTWSSYAAGKTGCLVTDSTSGNSSAKFSKRSQNERAEKSYEDSRIRRGSIRLLFWVDGQQHAIAEDCLKAFERAVLVTASSGAAADTDGADHLAVDDDGQAAGIGEE